MRQSQPSNTRKTKPKLTIQCGVLSNNSQSRVAINAKPNTDKNAQMKTRMNPFRPSLPFGFVIVFSQLTNFFFFPNLDSREAFDVVSFIMLLILFICKK
jgi:hypothetical protein